MRLDPTRASLLAMLLSTTALVLASGYAGALGADEHRIRHAGVMQTSGDQDLFISYPVEGRPGDIVRVDEDSRPYLAADFDLYLVPLGHAQDIVGGTAQILAHARPVSREERVAQTIHLERNGTTSAMGSVREDPRAFRLFLGEGRPPVLQATIPPGATGIEVTWVNTTAGIPDDTMFEASITRLDHFWASLLWPFLAAEALLVVGAIITGTVWLRSSRGQQAHGAVGTRGLDTGDIVHLVEAAGTHLRRLRDTVWIAGVLLVACLAMGHDLLVRYLGDEPQSPTAPGAVHLAYLLAAALALGAWFILAYRSNRELERWRAHMRTDAFA
ncbi:MAG TPA: hypothetical protein VM286_05195 [Candidatus Thermoplasmatota archaeon]|nr:hypothetical protein [Candidatus Thermoplasmatota archaeon]